MPRQNKILIRNGTTTPSAVDFDTAEPAWDKTAGKLYIKDGAGNMVEVGAGGGGGGLTYFTEAESTTSPNNTVSVDSLTAAAATTNADVALVAKGTGATLAQVPDGTTTGGNKRGLRATDFQKTRTSSDQVASGTNSFIGGGARNKAGGENSGICAGILNSITQQHSVIAGGSTNSVSGQIAAIVGGFGNNASANYTFVGGGQSNTATTNHSFVGGGQNNEAKTNSHATCAGGYLNDATGQYSFAGGGSANTASGQQSVVGGGFDNAASAIRATVAGGNSNTASGTYSFIGGGFANSTSSAAYSAIMGGARGTARSITGYHVFPACNVPIADVSGVSQSALLLLGRETTDATATVLASNSSAAGTTNQVILPNNSAYAFKGTVIATVTGGGDTAAWEFKGAIKRGANAASTAIVGTVIKDVLAYDAGAASWDVTFTANTTNGGLKVEVTGAAATTIRWVAKLETTEVTY